MINVKELNELISQMSAYKPAKAIKVTTNFYEHLESEALSWQPAKLYPHVSPAFYQGLPVIIDDEIKTNYEFIY